MRLSVNFIANGTFYRAGEDIDVNLIPPLIRKYELRPEDEAPFWATAPAPTGQYVTGVSYQTDKNGYPMRDARTAAQEAIQTRALIEADEENWRRSGLSFYESSKSQEAKPQQGKSASQRLQDSSESQPEYKPRRQRYVRRGSAFKPADGELLTPGESLYVREIGVSPPKFIRAGKVPNEEE
jgi:hypothetical protein